ncbi:UDP-2-acetamido-2,6-beta-L-arabino-hexul-4-ose reductase [Devosia lucknowensis]|uniref:UDP-2-acetamido-2,6-beta-L-arabino-hexul-4-ose reductase n=1 Tax=Devosia lucknowensis TaxID=1096929 RepID=A0A1Y6G640_9HYPH|nr:NAD-dependent epimerase/dehydratase family protein [Devosia lucknowensis]SMQ85546.1 UDP-2-acetamido-2,6-beta-L-arabino-hexul-4-ose reductase [Devosia lucknowensis]
MPTIAVTGANGFIGRNLVVRLGEANHQIIEIARDLDFAAMVEKLSGAEFVVHLAGVNRPETEAEFETGNVGMSEKLARALHQLEQPLPLVFSSSIHADLDNPYGRSKRAAEAVLVEYGKVAGAPVHIWRLPNVFGKWCRPNYNSVVATFCNNIAKGLPIKVTDPGAALHLVYIDDVVDALLALIANGGAQPVSVEPAYQTTLGELVTEIETLRDSRQTLVTGAVGTGFRRALHATYLSYLEPVNFSYPLVTHTDPRGTFAEMLRTPDAGQFSFFTAHPGITRGGHYHHSKTEKFLVVQGKARFGFRHVLTDETFTLDTDASLPQVVETVPGWSHDITNIGDDTMVVMLWANEVFDRNKPDTITARVLP